MTFDELHMDESGCLWAIIIFQNGYSLIQLCWFNKTNNNILNDDSFGWNSSFKNKLPQL